MAVTRRAFLASLGVAAAAVTLNGLPWPAPADLSAPTFTSEFLSVGDVFTISGRYAINPITRKPTTHLQQFRVTAVSGDDVSVTPHRARPVKRSDVMPLGTR